MLGRLVCWGRKQNERVRWPGERAAMEDEDMWCLDWHEEDLGCDRKTTVRSQISSGRMNFQVGESSGCWVGGWPEGC